MNARRLSTLALVGVVSLLACVGASATNHYVDPNATGSGDGSSWANAWTNFASIAWGSIHGDDFLYISGGHTYTDTLTIGANGTAGHVITVSVGQDVGHNGVADLKGSYVDAAGRQYITLTGNVGGATNLWLRDFYDTTNSTFSNKILADASVGFTLDHAFASNVNQVISLVAASRFVVQNVIGVDVRGDAAVRAVNSPDIGFDGHFIQNCTFTMSINTATGFGPDGIQGSHSLTIRNNLFTVQKVSYSTSAQHCDYCQLIGNKNKVYGNQFLNIGDSGIDLDVRANPNPTDWWIYNNLFRITVAVDPFPEFIRVYSTGAPWTGLTRWRVLNNNFIDDSGWAAVLFSWAVNTPVLTDCTIANNIFVNSGPYSIPANASLVSGSFGFTNNVYQSGLTMTYNGATFNSDTFKAAIEPTATIGTPVFVAYTPLSPSNNFQLQATDTVATGHGEDLSAWFTTDILNNTRTAPWSVGAYQQTNSVLPNPPTHLRAKKLMLGR